MTCKIAIKMSLILITTTIVSPLGVLYIAAEAHHSGKCIIEIFSLPSLFKAGHWDERVLSLHQIILKGEFRWRGDTK